MRYCYVLFCDNGMYYDDVENYCVGVFPTLEDAKNGYVENREMIDKYSCNCPDDQNVWIEEVPYCGVTNLENEIIWIREAK